MKLFVKNIDRSINEAQLEFLFSKFGEVVNTKIIYDRITWESRGFGFLEMKNKEDALKALQELNGKEVKGRILVVEEYAEKKK